MLDAREAFLRAIFDSPADDTPRLVYADWLDEYGEEPLAELIRVQCELAAGHEAVGRERTWHLVGRRRALIQQLYGYDTDSGQGIDRGFPTQRVISVTADELADPLAFRTASVTKHPEWFGADELYLADGRVNDGRAIDTLFTAAAARRVVRLVLSGIEEEIVGSRTDNSGAVFDTGYDFRYRPVITPAGVAALAAHRGAHRLQVLDLTNNELDNDAARALVRSPFLDNLTELRLRDGNRLRGRVWQDVIERFGEDVAT